VRSPNSDKNIATRRDKEKNQQTLLGINKEKGETHIVGNQQKKTQEEQRTLPRIIEIRRNKNKR
jgi:hypothetical protein